MKAFRVEITTGMSAPPIGSTAKIPSRPATSRISQNSSSDSEPAAITAARPTTTTASTRLTAEPPGSLSGRPEISSCSLPKATFEPQKLIEPMIAANSVGISCSSGMSPPASRNSTTLISATAPPPTPLNSATICGIAVIFTERALGIPTAVPISTPAAIRPYWPERSSISVANTAIAIPPAATRLPRTAVRGPLSIRSPMMNRLKATM